MPAVGVSFAVVFFRLNLSEPDVGRSTSQMQRRLLHYMKSRNVFISNSLEPSGLFWGIKRREGKLQAPFSGIKERSSTNYISESMKEFMVKYR